MDDYIYSFWAPLMNFSSATLPINLNDTVQIRLATDFEKKDIISRSSDKWMNIQKSDYVLNIAIRKDTPEQKLGENFLEARRELEKAISILRLYREEPIGYNLIVQQYSNEETYAYTAKGILHYVLWATSDQKDTNKVYELKENREIDKLIDFFNKYFHLTSWDMLELSISYFNKSYIEPYTPRDSFLDIMICLENLFLKDSFQELGYKLSLRMAHLLAEDSEERKGIFEIAKKYYSLRSRIVHGSNAKVTESQLLQIRNYARASIQWFLMHKDKWSESELDELVLGDTYFPHA